MPQDFSSFCGIRFFLRRFSPVENAFLGAFDRRRKFFALL
jgi:hypothetical protein